MDEGLDMPDSELTREIIGAAIAVHTALGPGIECIPEKKVLSSVSGQIAAQ